MSDETKLSILIVDDSDTTRAMIKRIINMLGLEDVRLLEAANGAIGLERIQSTKVDLVLADLNMPVMDGFQMISKLRENPATRAIPVIVISAQPDPEQVQELTRTGIAGYLPKPFTAERVRGMIMPILDAARAKQAAAEPPPPPVDTSFNLTLAEALAQALETMAFISPELMNEPMLPRQPGGVKLVRIEFRGRDTHGSLALAVSPRLGDTIAGNLDAIGDSAGDDALKELANVTCGLLLRMRPGGGVGFQLDPPSLSMSAATTTRALFETDDVVALRADDEVIAATVVTDAAFYGA